VLRCGESWLWAAGNHHAAVHDLGDLGLPLVNDETRLVGVTELRVDETVVLHAGAYPLIQRSALSVPKDTRITR
jgi:hypothetical protein